MEYLSQAGQDEWVCNFFKFKKGGYYLDIGAYDGKVISNTYLLETELGWDGICCEAHPGIYAKLITNRKCKCLNVAVSDFNGESRFDDTRDWSSSLANWGNITVPVKTIDVILKENNAPKIIDYLSLDVEGAEPNVLFKFPFREYEIIIATIEHNKYLIGNYNKEVIKNIMFQNGFDMYKEDVREKVENNPLEDWFINKKYLHMLNE